MSNGSGGGGGAGKIILIVLGVLLLIGLVCCGGGYFFVVKPGMDIGLSTASFTQNLQEKYGDVRLQPVEQGQQHMVLAIGFPEDTDFSPENVTKLQDEIWTLYTESFSESGFPFCKSIAIGIGRGSANSGYVEGWDDKVVTVEELEARTGIAAPPPNKFESWAGPEDVRIETTPDEK